MGTMPSPPNLMISYNKEDIFYILLRLYQMMNDADPFSDLAEDEDESVVFEADEEEGEEEGEETEASPPAYFQALYAAQDEFTVAVVNEYIGLFALLSTPLDHDPELKKEFLAYALARGEEIEFTNERRAPPAPKLFIVPPEKDNSDNSGKKPPKK
jgi:hypothetical protein